MRRFLIGLLILVSAVGLLVSSTSLWVRHNVINTHVFVSNVSTMIDLPPVEARLNQRVTDTVMVDPEVGDAVDSAVSVLPPRLQQFRPTVEDGIRSMVSAGVGQLLTDEPFRPLTDAALTSAQEQLVNGQPVRFTLGQAKERVPDSAKEGLTGQVLDLLPDDAGVTLLTPADSPQVYNAIDLLRSVWWWLGLLALAALAGALSISRHRRGTLRAWSVTITVLMLLQLIALRVAGGPLVVQAEPEDRDAVGAVYDVVAQSLRWWTLWVVGLALLVLVLTLVWGRLGIVAGVRRGWGSARGQMAAQRDALAAGTPAGQVPVVVEDSWLGRVAASTRAFTEGLELDQRAAQLGGFVEQRRKPAQWLGIVIGALVLLFWPSPTLSALIWVVSLVALYLAALEWLQGRALVTPAEGADELIVS